ncbi:flavodoxin [Erwinia billingiae]|uniref:flavodoxin n=1 Tax=Erwinia billingiae TaxID=182337 RepID=UPI002246D376|nr:flavodoxin [Erwinia billingiae]MCX0500638.1 flavodoxin [Erwinia billingiae]
MSSLHDADRRRLLTALAGVAVATSIFTPAAASPVIKQNNSRKLVVCFSRSGNTRVIAGVIHRSLKTDYVEIEPVTAYPADYFQTVALAKKQREDGVKPELKNVGIELAGYQTIYLGFPIWGTSVPPVVQTFLASHNLTGKLLIPFITHGGYGVGDSAEILADLAPQARREKPLVIECDQERKTTETVMQWLEVIRS